MKKIAFFLLVVLFASCTESAIKPVFKTRKVRVLENNTTSYIDIPSRLDSVYRYNDTVWVNLKTHKIDDIDSTAMKCVIIIDSSKTK